MVWKKELPDGKMAVLLMNNRNTTANTSCKNTHNPRHNVVSRDKSDRMPAALGADLPPDMHFHCGSGGCAVRDIYAHKDLGLHGGGFTAKGVAPHDSAFVVVQQCVKEATYPFQCINNE